VAVLYIPTVLMDVTDGMAHSLSWGAVAIVAGNTRGIGKG